MPWTWDVGYGAVLAVMVAGQGLSQPWAILTVAFGLCGLALLVKAWQAKTGMWVNGYSPKRARWVAIGTAVVLVALMLANMGLTRILGLWWAPLVAGLLAFVIGIVAGRLWWRFYLRDLEDEAVSARPCMTP